MLDVNDFTGDAGVGVRMASLEMGHIMQSLSSDWQWIMYMLLHSPQCNDMQ